MNTENAEITGVSITMSDYGCLTFYIYLKGKGWECGYGGYCIAHGYLGSDNFNAENGDGLIAMMKIMDVVGVEKWEDLKGKYCRVNSVSCGDKIKVIGNLIEDKWFNIGEFFESCREKTKE